MNKTECQAAWLSGMFLRIAIDTPTGSLREIVNSKLTAEQIGELFVFAVKDVYEFRLDGGG